MEQPKRLSSAWVQIITTPAGEAPLWVREAWIHLKFPAFVNVHNTSTKVISGEVEEACDLVLIDEDVALNILRKKHPQAAAWWNCRGFPRQQKAFAFRREECNVLDTPTPCAVRVWDEMGGWGADPDK